MPKRLIALALGGLALVVAGGVRDSRGSRVSSSSFVWFCGDFRARAFFPRSIFFSPTFAVFRIRITRVKIFSIKISYGRCQNFDVIFLTLSFFLLDSVKYLIHDFFGLNINSVKYFLG